MPDIVTIRELKLFKSFISIVSNSLVGDHASMAKLLRSVAVLCFYDLLSCFHPRTATSCRSFDGAS